MVSSHRRLWSGPLEIGRVGCGDEGFGAIILRSWCCCGGGIGQRLILLWLRVDLSRLASNPVFPAQLIRDFSSVDLDALFVLSHEISTMDVIGGRSRRTRIQSGRLIPQPRHSMLRRMHVLHEFPSRCSSHF